MLRSAPAFALLLATLVLGAVLAGCSGDDRPSQELRVYALKMDDAINEALIAFDLEEQQEALERLETLHVPTGMYDAHDSVTYVYETLILLDQSVRLEELSQRDAESSQCDTNPTSEREDTSSAELDDSCSIMVAAQFAAIDAILAAVQAWGHALAKACHVRDTEATLLASEAVSACLAR